METFFLQQLVNGLTLGSVYGLIAIGYTMVFGIIGMVNFAHGDVFMVGTFTALIAFLLWLPELGFWFEVVKWALMWIAFLLTVVTGVDYLYEAYKLRKASLAAGGPVALRDGRWQPLAEPVVPASDADHEPPS